MNEILSQWPRFSFDSDMISEFHVMKYEYYGSKATKHTIETNSPNLKKNTNIKTIKRSNKLFQALQLPVIANINPCSAYNKADELRTLIDQEEVDILFFRGKEKILN